MSTTVKPFYESRRDLNTAKLIGRKHRFDVRRLNSKVVKFAGYSDERSEMLLILRTREGRWAPYFYRVEKSVYTKLLNSGSPGQYLNDTVRGQTCVTSPEFMNWNYVQQLVKELKRV